MCMSELLTHERASHIISVFVGGRSRPTIMKDMAARIDRGDIARERVDAIQV